MRRTICIVTSEAISYNPRALKEADALASAGFDVRVIGCQKHDWLVRWDQTLLDERSWIYEPILCHPAGLLPRYRYAKSALRQRCCRALAAFSLQGGIAERAHSRMYAELAARAERVPAQLYIAHNPQALPPAFRAARRCGARLAFDSEDLHSSEASNMSRPLEAGLISFLENRYLPACRYVTAPSSPVAKAIAERYGIALPVTVHNVFPWSDRSRIDGKNMDRRGPELSLYWYSQVIGLDRGIQDAIRAAALLARPVQIHLRGALSREVEHELRRLARECGVESGLFFHPPVHPDELLSRAAEHDVGLALEPVDIDENRRLTVTNKLFLYLIAGLAVAASDTTGQRSVMGSCGDAGFLYESGDCAALADQLRKLADDPALLRARKAAALRAAQERWCWEKESRTVVELAEQAVKAPNTSRIT